MPAFLALALGVMAGPAPVSATEAPSQPLWLIGKWCSEAVTWTRGSRPPDYAPDDHLGAGCLDWAPAKDGGLLGEECMHRSGLPDPCDVHRITARGGGLRYSWQHTGDFLLLRQSRLPLSFREVSRDGTSIAFERGKRSSLRRVAFRRTGDVLEIENSSATGKPVISRYRLWRP